MVEYELVRTGVRDLVPMHRTGDPNDHISAIIRSLCVKLGHFEVDEDETPEEVTGRETRWELGSAFEEAIRVGLRERWAQSNPDRYIVIGEVEHDDLIGSPDILDTEAPAIIEVKLTWLSANHEPDSIKFWKYWVQLMAYCRMTGIQAAELHVCHVLGDYRQRRYPIYNVWAPKGGFFPWSTLEQNWRMLKSHREAMREEEE